LLLAGKQPAELRIYDPYYCAGQVKRNLESLGFPNVYNVCEDFYAVIAEGRTPEYDVLITNPPYGRVPFDHVEKLTAFLATQAKPWLVVQPAYCYTKDYWPVLMGGLAPQPFFLTPASPRGYIYQTPKGMRGVLKAKKLKTSPFVTFWYGWFGEHQGGLFQWWMEHGFRECSGMSLAAQSLSLPDGFKSSNDRSRRKAKRRPGENTTPTAHASQATEAVRARAGTTAKRAKKGSGKRGPEGVEATECVSGDASLASEKVSTTNLHADNAREKKKKKKKTKKKTKKKLKNGQQND